MMLFDLWRIRKDGTEVKLNFAPLSEKEADTILGKLRGGLAEQLGMSTVARPTNI